MEKPQVITTMKVLERVLPSLHEAADQHPEQIEGLTPVEQAALLAGLNNAMGALQEAAKEGVLFSPQNQIGSLLQSMVAENPTSLEPLPGGQALEAKFDTHDWIGWLGTFWKMLQRAKKFDWQKPPGAPEVVAQFGNTARLAVFSDWGTGLYGAPLLQDSIQRDPKPVSLVMHLGDVYYSGTEPEFRSRFSAFWPKRDGALNRALNGNHEMYSGGTPFMKALEPFNQRTTCFAYQNDHWIIVGLDSAYLDHDLGEGQAEWLTQIVARAEGRRVVLFSHHQPFSLFSGQGPGLVSKLKPLLDGNKIFAWYWGHEHQCLIYDKHPQWNLYGRCIGHAGMPEFRPRAMGDAISTRQFRRFEGKNNVPGAWVLDGPNPYVKGEEKKFTPHGYVTLEFTDHQLAECVHDADGTRLRDFELP